MLRSANPRTSTRKILTDFRRAVSFPRGHKPSLQTDFEHGQWWITDRLSGAQWSVHDTQNGFGFEQVSQGE